MTRKATHQGVKSHNRRLVLRSIFSGEATNRAALSNHTGLTKPTISDIVAELIADGFLEERGHGESTESGGKRPRLLHFKHDSRQIIGVSIDPTRVYGILTDLNGEIIASHHAHLKGAQGLDALAILQEVINGLIAQQDAPLLCISVGTPGIIYSKAGLVKSAPLLGWHDLHLADHLSDFYDVAVCIGNNTELATRSLVTRTQEATVRNLVMILVNGSVEIGMVFNGRVYHHSGDLGLLRVPSDDNQLASYLGWDFVIRRIEELRQQIPSSLTDHPDYLDIRYGYMRGDALCVQLYEELAGHISQIFAWITGIIRPDHIALAGDMVELGDQIITLATQQTADWLPPDLVDAVTYSLANDSLLSVTGAVAHGLDRELLGVSS
jgi:predicted NBD/HSP70 family sugar kinase